MPGKDSIEIRLVFKAAPANCSLLVIRNQHASHLQVGVSHVQVSTSQYTQPLKYFQYYFLTCFVLTKKKKKESFCNF